LLRGLAVLLVLVTLLAVSVEVYLRSRARTHWRGMERAAERELLGGGLQGLLRARAMALGGAAIADDEEAAATVALASAMLASDYGLDETAAALTAADAIDAALTASPRAQALELASRALVELVAGQPARAAALAHQSIAQGHRQASPLFALGRARFRQGDLPAAGSAFQAALVREPGFAEARAAWAEVWLEWGERDRARDALVGVLRRTPDHGRAGLLLAELGADAPGGREAWPSICKRDEAASPVMAAACDLARAEEAWRRHARGAAIGFAENAGRRRPAAPRLLGRAAQLLASLGAVDLASASLDEAIRVGHPNLPSLRWARIAVVLGRGQLANPPDGLPATSSPWAPALLTRIALASGGIPALTAALPERDDGNRDLHALAALVETGASGDAAQATAAAPVRAYVQGLRARLAGKTALAADLLAGALHGHGDACRAAGEYLAVCRELGRVPEASAFAALAGENSRCVNLPAALAAANARRRRAGAR
jgi:hypothetical protein